LLDKRGAAKNAAMEVLSLVGAGVPPLTGWRPGFDV